MSAPLSDEMHKKLLSDAKLTANDIMRAYRESNPVDETFADMVSRLGPRPVYEVWSPRFYKDAVDAGFRVYHLGFCNELRVIVFWGGSYGIDTEENPCGECCARWIINPCFGGIAHGKTYLVAKTATPEEVVKYIPEANVIHVLQTYERAKHA